VSSNGAVRASRSIRPWGERLPESRHGWTRPDYCLALGDRQYPVRVHDIWVRSVRIRVSFLILGWGQSVEFVVWPVMVVPVSECVDEGLQAFDLVRQIEDGVELVSPFAVAATEPLRWLRLTPLLSRYDWIQPHQPLELHSASRGWRILHRMLRSPGDENQCAWRPHFPRRSSKARPNIADQNKSGQAALKLLAKPPEAFMCLRGWSRSSVG
jgi:hypothetical protein